MSECAKDIGLELSTCETAITLERDAQRLVASVLTLIRVSRDVQRDYAELTAAVKWIEAEIRTNPSAVHFGIQTTSILEAFRARPHS